MATKHNDEYTKAIPPQTCHPPVAVAQPHVRTSCRRSHSPAVTDEEEMAMVETYVIVQAILGVAPLVLFLVIHYFLPNLFHLLDLPTK